MALYDQGYRHWDGPLSGHATRWFTITQNGVRQALRNKWFVAVLLLAQLPMVGLSFVAFGMLQAGDRIAQMEGADAAAVKMAEGLGADFFLQIVPMEIFWVVVIGAFVGSGLVARDRESRALEIYFSRPLTRLDYLFGKFGIVFTFSMIATIVPSLLLYTVAVICQPTMGYLKQTLTIPLALAATSIVISVAASAVVLAFSSLGSRPRLVGVGWIAFHFVTLAFAGLFAELTEKPEFAILGFLNNLERMAIAFLGATVSREYQFDWMWSALVLAVLTVAGMLLVLRRVRAVEAVK